MPSPKRELLYIADPMCSWCWGFAPVITAIREKYAAELDISLILGGLRVGTTKAYTDEARQRTLGHWKTVQETTGQPFNLNFKPGPKFHYDTEPSCRATVTLRKLKPEATFPYFESLHHAFYVENRDVTNPEILSELAEAQGIDADIFLKTFEADETRQLTHYDFERTQNFGIGGFPSAILRDEHGLKLLTRGYQPLEQLTPQIDQWLEQGAAPSSI